MHPTLSSALEAICRERDDQKYAESYDAVEALLDEFGEDRLAERLFDEIPRTVPFELVAELFELLAWQTNDNGSAIHRVIEEWLIDGSDNRKLLVALNLGAYPFIDCQQMEHVLSALAEKNVRVSARCMDLIRSRSLLGKAP